MKDNDWRGQLQEIIEEETDMERPMIPRYAKGYAKLVLEDFISSEIDKARERELEWILKNCSGGGNWRRIVNQRLSKLKDNR